MADRALIAHTMSSHSESRLGEAWTRPASDAEKGCIKHMAMAATWTPSRDIRLEADRLARRGGRDSKWEFGRSYIGERQLIVHKNTRYYCRGRQGKQNRPAEAPRRAHARTEGNKPVKMPDGGTSALRDFGRSAIFASIRVAG